MDNRDRTTEPPLLPAGHMLLSRALLVVSAITIFLVAHGPAHLRSTIVWVTARGTPDYGTLVAAPAAAQSLFWLPSALLLAGLMLGSSPYPVAVARLTPRWHRDVPVSVVVALIGLGIRIWPLLQDAWIKPNYDEGVYLGAAWLLHTWALPYRNYVLAHPPGGLALLWPAASLIMPWHDNAAALLAARATAVLCDSLTIGLLYLAARHLAPPSGALLAAAVYAADAAVIHFARGVRLEPLQAPFQAAGTLMVMAALNGRRTEFAAGVSLALAITIKLTGALVLLAALLIFAFERRWRDVRDLVAGAVLGVLLVCGWSIATSGLEIVRQTVLLQLTRPPDPLAGRWSFLLGEPRMALTAGGMVLGAGALARLSWRRRVAPGWLFICLWISLTLMLFAYGASFYDHYYVKLALPVALLAAAVPQALPAGRGRALARLGLVVVLIALAAGQVRFWPEADRGLTARREVARVGTFGPDDRVLNLMPLINVLVGWPFARPPGGPYILDTVLGTAYLRSTLNKRWADADAHVGAAIAAADVVVVDPWTSPLPGLLENFTPQRLTPDSSLRLFTRVNQPGTIVQVGSTLQLLRRTPARTEVAGGSPWLVQPLHWRATAPPPADQTLALHLVDRNGARVAQLDVPVNGGMDWTPNVVTTIEYRLPLPAELAPGTYHLKAIVYSLATGTAVPMRTADGQNAESLDLLPIVVEP